MIAKTSNLWACYLQFFPKRRDALSMINEQCGTNYQANRIGEFITGARPTPENVKVFLRQFCIQSVLKKHTKKVYSEDVCISIAQDLN